MAPEVHPSQDPASAIVDPSKVRPVTTLQDQNAAEQVGKPVPPFKMESTLGKTVDYPAISDGKPVFIYFIQKECPCCVEAEPFISTLFEFYAGDAKFVGVINAGVAEGKTWAMKNEIGFPLLSDEKTAWIKAMKVESGVTMALVNPDGVIQKVWPGYSKPILTEIAQALNPKKEVPIFENAPEKPTSGCRF